MFLECFSYHDSIWVPSKLGNRDGIAWSAIVALIRWRPCLWVLIILVSSNHPCEWRSSLQVVIIPKPRYRLFLNLISRPKSWWAYMCRCVHVWWYMLISIFPTQGHRLPPKLLRVNTPLAVALRYKGPLYESTRAWCLFNIESKIRKLSAIWNKKRATYVAKYLTYAATSKIQIWMAFISTGHRRVKLGSNSTSSTSSLSFPKVFTQKIPKNFDSYQKYVDSCA